MIARGTSKEHMAIAAQTPVPTPKGFILASDLKPGGYIFNPEGVPNQILSVQSYVAPDCYEAHFDDGLTIEGDRHMAFMLQTRAYRDQQARWFKNRNSQFAKRLRRPLEKRTLAELAKEDLTLERGHAKYTLQTTGPLQYPHVDLPVPPYVFGLWIGSLAPSGHHWLKNDDFNSMQKKVRAVGFNLVRRRHRWGYAVEFFIRPSVRESFTVAGAPIPDIIPQSYLEADVDSRMALLDGLRDARNITESKLNPGQFMIRDAWRGIRRKQQLVEGLGMVSRLMKCDTETKYELVFRLRHENCAKTRRKIRKIAKKSAQMCVHVETESGFVAGEGFIAVC
jgi:hypothetical protein